MSLHYLVKYLCLKNRHAQEIIVANFFVGGWNKQLAPVSTTPRKNEVSIGSPVLGLAVVTNRQTDTTSVAMCRVWLVLRCGLKRK